MSRGEVDVILVGADRVAANGDTANKVGTYPLAVLAARHGIPFYVCAPTSSIDPATPDGAAIEIEERPADEVLLVRGVRDRAARDRGPQPLVRRHAGGADHGDRDRGGGDRRAVRAGLADAVATRPPAGPVRPDRAAAARPRGGRRRRRADAPPPTEPPDGQRRHDERRARGLAIRTVTTARRCGRSSRPTASSPPTRSATSRTASSRKTRWGGAFDGERLVALALEYSGLTPQPLFAMGRADGIEAILRDVVRPRAAYVAVLPEAMPAVETVYRVDPGPQMVRMWVDRARFRPYPAERPAAAARPTSASSTGSTSSGSRRGCRRQPIADGVYFGDPRRWPARRRGRDPRHQPQARLAVVGNVLTHVDYRGRGYATAVTGAVTAELLRTCDQVVLNVRSDNPPALQAYRRLGYAEHVRFEERLAHRLGSPWPDFTAPIRRFFTRREN